MVIGFEGIQHWRRHDLFSPYPLDALSQSSKGTTFLVTTTKGADPLLKDE